jgi:hypothetical protein
VKGAESLAAGLVFIVVAAACTVAGVLLGNALGSGVAGGFIGGIVGVFVGGRVVYRVYMVPLREESLKNDYSHLTPKWTDDD